jgi:hypothetical protein
MTLRSVVLTLVLLPLTGCAGAAAVPRADPAPPPVVSDAPTATGSSAPTSGPGPVSVPTVRATVPPLVRERPAPRRFTAASVAIDLPVVRVGVDDQGLMELPETVGAVGWYAYSARPGARTGTTVLAAHVDTRAEGLGPFARLRELDEGDELGVTDDRGQDRRYVVTQVTAVQKREVPLDRVFRRDGAPELTVITCGGSFDRRRGYSDNVIVTARPR